MPFLPLRPPLAAGPPHAVVPPGVQQRSGGFLGWPASPRLSSFRGAEDTLRLMAEHVHGLRGEKSFLVRQFTEWVTKHVFPKDYAGEILAIRNCFVQPSPVLGPPTPLFKYTNDPRHVELVKDPQRLVEEILQHGTTVLDCDEIAMMAACMALQVGREAQFVALGFEPRALTHVGARVKEPKSDTWIWVDPVAGPREREAAQRAVEMLVYDLD